MRDPTTIITEMLYLVTQNKPEISIHKLKSLAREMLGLDLRPADKACLLEDLSDIRSRLAQVPINIPELTELIDTFQASIFA